MERQPYRVALGMSAKALRVSRGFQTAADLADRTGFSKSTAYKIEGGKDHESSLTLRTLQRYADAVGITLGELFELADKIHERANA